MTSEAALDAVRKLRAHESIALDKNDNLVIISFELPVRVTRLREPQEGQSLSQSDYQVAHTNALLLPGLHKLRRSFDCNILFVGYCGLTTQDPAEQELIIALLTPFDCRPVFPAEADFEAYVTFCQKCLSPLFHSIIHLDSQLQEPFNQSHWLAYQSMNALWASEATVSYANDSDLVWVHDYHLLLAPQYLSRRYKRANIGLFLHVPFPSTDLFRCIPARNEIMRGMLCADLVGFHFFDYARHFLNANKRLLGLEHNFTLGGFMGIEYGGRRIMIKIGHVNVEYNSMRQELQHREDVAQLARDIRSEHLDKFIFGAVDRCDQLAGLLLKFRAFQTFLKDFPYARNQIVLIQYAYPSRGSVLEAKRMSQDLTTLAHEINDEFGMHIILKIQPVRQADKWALLTAADCLIDSSIRDGLNLIAYEYIACRGDEASHILLSEFTGCSSTLASAHRINPWQLKEVASKMDWVVSTPAEVVSEQWARDQQYLSKHSLETWAKDFLCDLQRARKTAGKVYMQCGFGSNFRVLSIDQHFRPLDINDLVHAYRKAPKRLLFFDHEGTLAPDKRHLAVVPSHEALTALGSPPSVGVRESLRLLCEDSDNTVVIFSGRDRTCLDGWFGDIPGIGLCAEHGYYVKMPRSETWMCMSTHEDFTWKEVAFELMSQYVKRTQGSMIENKGSALVFQYRDADPDFGSWQAKELASYLEEFLFGLPVSVVSGKGYVEARVSGVSKGLTAEHMISQAGQVDFILAIGDDRSDEDMFAAVNKRNDEEETSSTRKTPTMKSISATNLQVFSGTSTQRFFSVTVGKKPSQAKFFVTDTEEVSEVLNALKAHTTQPEPNFSTETLLVQQPTSSSADHNLWMTTVL